MHPNFYRSPPQLFSCAQDRESVGRQGRSAMATPFPGRPCPSFFPWFLGDTFVQMMQEGMIRQFSSIGSTMSVMQITAPVPT